MARRLFVVVRGLLSSCGAQAPERAGSIVAACAGVVVVALWLSSCSTQA